MISVVESLAITIKSHKLYPLLWFWITKIKNFTYKTFFCWCLLINILFFRLNFSGYFCKKK